MSAVVITEFMDQPAVDALSAKFSVLYDPTLVDDLARLKVAIAGAEAVIVRNRTQVNRDLLASAPKCRVVGRLGVGLDNIDLPACQERGITVIPATGANARAVAEYVVATAFVLLRGAFSCSVSVANGQWPRLAYSNGLEIHGRVMGVVGFGGIGRLVSDLVRPLGMRVIAFDPALSETDPAFSTHQAQYCARLDDVLRQADVVSLHVPLNEQTRHLINAQRIALMKSTAVLINTARGGVVDEQALVEAIRAKALGGAALDVFEREPLPGTTLPNDLPQLILTPA
jgi:(S)-sulfolactate dehydrogenase